VCVCVRVASAELAQLKAEDPLPLRRAKITQEAALRCVRAVWCAHVCECVCVCTCVGSLYFSCYFLYSKVEKSENALMRELKVAQEAVAEAAAKGGGNAPGLMCTCAAFPHTLSAAAANRTHNEWH